MRRSRFYLDGTPMAIYGSNNQETWEKIVSIGGTQAPGVSIAVPEGCTFRYLIVDKDDESAPSG